MNAHLRKLRERYEVRQYVGFAADEYARAIARGISDYCEAAARGD